MKCGGPSKLFFAALALAFCASINSLADWNQEALTWATNYNSSPILFESAAEATVWGAVRSRRYAFMAKNYRVAKIQVPSTFSQPLPVLLYVKNLPHHADIMRAPLMIYLPGIFSNARDPFSFRAVVRFSTLGYHVAVLPNPWSTDYIGSGSKSAPGDLDEEARSVLVAIAAVKNVIGANHISSVQLDSESYGAFLATAVAAYDSLSESPLIDGNLTLYGLPINLENGMKILDVGMAETRDQYNTSCGAWHLWTFFSELFVSSHQDEFGSHLSNCSPSILYESFQADLEQTAVALNREGGGSLIPAVTDHTSYKQWQRSFNFETFLTQFIPQNQDELKSVKATAAYWLANTKPEVRRRVRIMSAVDDPLDSGQDWNMFKSDSGLDENQVILLSWGGHLGFMETPAFERFFKQNYAQQN